MMRKWSVGSWVLLQLGVVVAAPGAEVWTAPQVHLPQTSRHPVIACTPEELARLRAAYAGTGPGHRIIAERVAGVDRFLAEPVTYPARGGQHNQWYQCDKCELSLETISDTQHRCPKCGKVYTGEPYDDVVFKRYHSKNLGRMHQAAWAYAITSDRKYADYAAGILLGYADRYLKYPYHTNSRTKEGQKRPSGGHINEQTLGEASTLSQLVAPAYDLVHNSPALTDADRQTIERQLILPMLQNIDKHKAGKSNWQTWHNAAMLWGGAVIGDASWIEKAIAQPGNGFTFQMTECLSEEGMWYENSWGYHFYTLHALVEMAEGARRLGIDLWGHPNLKKMFLLPIRYAMPDGSLPRFADSVNTTVQSIGSLGEPAYMVYRDPLLAAFLPKEPTFQSVLLGRGLTVPTSRPAVLTGSEVMASAGHAILRTAGPAGLAAAFTFGPYGGGHGHLDKLSFVLFGHGRELGVDPGRASSQAYRLPIHKNWYKATLSHNTVVVDRQPQKPAAGRLRCFAGNGQYAAVVADCDAAYDGVLHRRLLVMTPSYLLVLDRLESSDKDRRFDWLYHSRGNGAHCEAANGKVDLSSEGPGYSYIEKAYRGTTDDMINVSFSDKRGKTYLTMSGNPQSTVVTGDGPGSSILERVPLCLISRIGRQKSFAAVIEPVASDDKPSVSSVRCRQENGTMVVEINRAKGIDTITLSDKCRIRVESGQRLQLQAEP